MSKTLLDADMIQIVSRSISVGTYRRKPLYSHVKLRIKCAIKRYKTCQNEQGN